MLLGHSHGLLQAPTTCSISCANAVKKLKVNTNSKVNAWSRPQIRWSSLIYQHLDSDCGLGCLQCLCMGVSDHHLVGILRDTVGYNMKTHS